MERVEENPTERRLSKEKRQEAIAELVLEHRSVAAAVLAEQFDVSLVTVHRDLDELAAGGLLRRFHGGASAIRDSLFEPDISYRMRMAIQAKTEIAHSAIDLVTPNSSLLLDDSSTSLALARLLPSHSPLTVVTPFLEAIKVLSLHKEIRLIGLGGDYLPQQHSFGGPGLLASLKDIRVNTLFASTSALDFDGIYHQEPEVVTNKRAMMRVADRCYLLVDRTKLDQNAVYRISGLSDWDGIIVDSQADSDSIARLEDSGGKIIVAKSPLLNPEP